MLEPRGLEAVDLEGADAPPVRAFRTVFLHGSGVVLVVDVGEPRHRAYYLPTALANRLAREVVTFSKRLAWRPVRHTDPLTATAADRDVAQNLKRAVATRLVRVGDGTVLGIEMPGRAVSFHRWPDACASMALSEIRDAFDRGWFPAAGPVENPQGPTWMR